LRQPEKHFIVVPMFSDHTITLSLPYCGLLLAGLLLRVAR
jgi:hypothetical protein